MKLIKAILNEPWMVDPGALEAWMPLVVQLIQGKEVTFQEERPLPYAVSSSRTRYRDYNQAPAGSVAVHPVIGPITKYDGWCTEGTETLMRRMAFADGHQNITAHVLEIDSGGGQATNIETVARFIRTEINKPVVAWYNGMAASAAYFIASAADEIYAGQVTDLAGSIGCLITFADFRKMYEEAGITIHEVYADQSKEKNADFRAALEGKYEKLRETVLNPHAQCFIDTVREFRPITDEKVFAGGIYSARQAIDTGLIDGISTFQQAVDRAVALAEQSSPSSITQSTTMQRIESVLGYSLELQDGGAFLRRDELAKLDSHLVLEDETPVANETLTAINDRLAAIEANQTQLSETVTSQQQAFAELQENVQELGDAPGAGPTQVATEQDPATDSDAAPSALDELEAAARSGDRVYIE